VHLSSENRRTNLIGGEKNMEVFANFELFLELCPSLFIPSVIEHRKTGTEAE